MAIDSPES